MTDLDLYLQLFDYHLPQSQIAQVPATPRDSSKLLVMDRHSGQIKHHVFKDLAQILTPNDVLVLNQTKVFPARLSGKKSTGGKAEILLTQETGVGEW